MSSSTTTSTDVMIEARGLSKFYGEFAATQDVTFTVPRGQICAFLGPNGAGKRSVSKPERPASCRRLCRAGLL